MFSNQNIFTFLAASSMIVAVATTQSHINFKLLNLLARSQDFNISCLISHVSEIQEISDSFEVEVIACHNNADKQRSDADLETLESRESLANLTEIYCENIIQCKEQSTIKLEFECYRDNGNDNYKGFQNISNEATSELTKYMQKISSIRYDENICINNAKRTFDEQILEAKEKLDKCLKGEGWPTPNPTPKPTTTTTSIPTTTAEVTTTTEREETTPPNSETTTASKTTEPEENTTRKEEQ